MPTEPTAPEPSPPTVLTEDERALLIGWLPVDATDDDRRHVVEEVERWVAAAVQAERAAIARGLLVERDSLLPYTDDDADTYLDGRNDGYLDGLDGAAAAVRSGVRA